MRLLLHCLGSSVAMFAAIACSGVAVSPGERGSTQGGSAGAGLTAQAGRSSTAAGFGGRSDASSRAPSSAGGDASTGGSLAVGGTNAGGESSSDTVLSGGQSAIGGAPGSTAGSLNTLTGGAGAGGTSTVANTATSGAAQTGGVAATGGTSATLAFPTIASVSPVSGIVTTTIAITGRNFGATQGPSTVTIAGSAVTPSYWSDTSIEVAIPRAVRPGATSIAVKVGSAQSNSSTFEVVLPRTVYINRASQPTNSIGAFSLSANGTPTELSGSPYTTGDAFSGSMIDATTLAFHRATRRLFAVNDTSIMVFDIDPVSGQLRPTGNAPFSTGASSGNGIAVNALGTLVYSTNNAVKNSTTPRASISAFTVSSAGNLTAVSGSPFEHLGAASASPALLDGDQLLVVNNKRDLGPDFNSLVVHRVDSTTGALTPVAGSPYPIGLNAWSAHADPSGTWYYLADTLTSARLAGYALLNSTGAPVVLAGTPIATNTTSQYANGMAFTRDGTRLYVGLYDGNQLSGFSLNAGIPTLLSGSPFTMVGLSAITTLAISRDGSLLVMADGVNSVLAVHTVDAAGIPKDVGNGGSFASVGRATGLVIAE
ncbi:MAG TPA: IPT/TIG domain-containing protein [Polyangiaceae bacterium]|nr:IPT/TIG domain-containing protein [Polyangiaceae bacterium]